MLRKVLANIDYWSNEIAIAHNQFKIPGVKILLIKILLYLTHRFIAGDLNHRILTVILLFRMLIGCHQLRSSYSGKKYFLKKSPHNQSKLPNKAKNSWVQSTAAQLWQLMAFHSKVKLSNPTMLHKIWPGWQIATSSYESSWFRTKEQFGLQLNTTISACNVSPSSPCPGDTTRTLAKQP